MSHTVLAGGFAPGRLIDDRYELVQLLGSGGMAWVFLAQDRTLGGAPVAMKFLYPHLIQNEGSFTRFRNEVLIARKLVHPHAVRPYHIEISEGQAYITMDFVAGSSLRAALQHAENGAFQPDEAIPILLEICSALHHSHSLGIIHRDIKPDNVLLDAAGQAKVSDFGLAASLRRQNGISRAGQVLGTPYYMAPEQFLGTAADVRTDVYALGILMYELLVGRVPFTDSSLYGLATRHATEALPRDSTRPVSGELWSIIDRCTRKLPEDRYQSVGEIIDALSAVDGAEPGRVLYLSAPTESDTEPPEQHPAPFPRIRLRSAATIAALTLFLGTWLTPAGNNAVSLPVLLFDRALGREAVWLHRVLNVRTHWFTSLTDEVAVDRSRLWIRLAAGDDPNDPRNVGTKTSETPLARSVGYVEPGDVALLLAHGADPNAANPRDGQTPLHIALLMRDQRLIEPLLEAGANPNLRDKRGNTPLVCCDQQASVLFSTPDTIALLLRHGADPTIANDDGVDALDLAAGYGPPELVRKLMSALPDRGVKERQRLLTISSRNGARLGSFLSSIEATGGGTDSTVARSSGEPPPME